MEKREEILAFAVEATAGAVTPPTHLIPTEGTLVPMKSRWRPAERRGTTHKNYRSKVFRRWSEYDGEMPLDVGLMPFILNLLVRSGVTPTTPVGATLGRLWEYIDLGAGANKPETFTAYWGVAANGVMFQAPHGIVDEIVITADGTGEDGTTLKIKFHGGRMIKLTVIPTIPTLENSSLVGPMDWQVWIDAIASDGTGIGTTQIEGRLLSVTHTLTRNRSYKFIPDGPGGDHSYTRAGYGDYAMQTDLVMEVPDATQYDQYEGEGVVGVRVRHNGGFLEVDSVSTEDTYEYVEVDTYGPMDGVKWGDYVDTNRTLEVSIEGEVNALIGSDYRIAVYNQNAAL